MPVAHRLDTEQRVVMIQRVEAHELRRFRRSLVMLTPGQLALRRAEALALLAELAEVQGGLTSCAASGVASRTCRSNARPTGLVHYHRRQLGVAGRHKLLHQRPRWPRRDILGLRASPDVVRALSHLVRNAGRRADPARPAPLTRRGAPDRRYGRR